MKYFVVFALALVAAVNAANLDAVAQPAFASGRIINGVEAQKGEAPYIVSLKAGSHFCGGSLIAEDVVLTAAHCIIYQSFDVVAGLHSRNDESEVQIRKASLSKSIVHAKYGGGVGPYDIALVILDVPFNLNALTRDGNAAVGKINLPSGKFTTTGAGRLYGWGRDNSGALPNTLQTLDANIIGYSDCKAALPSSAPVDPTNVCSYTAGTADGACNGDSGGPLIVNTQDGSELVGIVSWGYTPCATTRYPSVYTSVESHKEWIASNIASSRKPDYPF